MTVEWKYHRSVCFNRRQWFWMLLTRMNRQRLAVFLQECFGFLLRVFSSVHSFDWSVKNVFPRNINLSTIWPVNRNDELLIICFAQYLYVCVLYLIDRRKLAKKFVMDLYYFSFFFFFLSYNRANYKSSESNTRDEKTICCSCPVGLSTIAVVFAPFNLSPVESFLVYIYFASWWIELFWTLAHLLNTEITVYSRLEIFL